MGACCSKIHQVSPEISTGSNIIRLDDDIEEKLPEINERSIHDKGISHDDEKYPPINLPHVFDDIIDAKHIKYMDYYKNENEELFWGIGIENESYLQWSVCHGAGEFKTLRPKRERYSVDYYKSFITAPLERSLESLKQCPELSYHVFINAHTFQKTDHCLEHKTLYDVHSTPNPKFTESIHDQLMKMCSYYKDTYEKSVVFDGDTIEFITQNYYCTTVQQSIDELIHLKKKWLEEIHPHLDRLRKKNQWNLPYSRNGSNGHFEYPKMNEGLVTLLTTSQRNLSICNTQTFHLNITLPTRIKDGIIVDKDRFIKDHLAFVSLIQILEPLIIAAYGTPDIFSIINTGYSIGSQRSTRSRYISIQSYDINLPINGKLLLQSRPEDPSHWYNRISGEYYQAHTEIGYDINVNKFKNHGVEIRFLDWFPEQYIKGLMDFLILVGQHAVTIGMSPYSKNNYHNIILKCLRKGFTGSLTLNEIQQILRDLKLEKIELYGIDKMSPYQLLCKINHVLYTEYSTSEWVRYMSPEMKEPELVNYNEIAFNEMYTRIFGKRKLIIRAESSIFEQRVPIVPNDIPNLSSEYDILVESSPTRCFSDDDYRRNGAIIIPSESWISYPQALVIGLKTIPKYLIPNSLYTHFYFAHCFKKQEGYKDILHQLQNTSLVDYEFMLDDLGKRTLSFCKQAGYVGGYLTLMAYYGLTISSSLSFLSFEFSEKKMNRFLEGTIPYGRKPRILLIGYGTVGKSCKQVFDRFHLECDVKRRNDPITADDILSYDILAHAIRLEVEDEKAWKPFLTEKDLDNAGRRLSLICDLSCDLDHKYNPLPIYKKYGTKEKPIQRLRSSTFFTPALDLIAVPYLPSFDPIHSSIEFSNELIWYLSEWKWVKYHPDRNRLTRAMKRSIDAFENALCGLD